ncbi:hypothetical protein FGB62_255g02 [Gracilaria domingensis]|nr:hypothetical protein FGB62_255g02 [Gracilaria domingensis]
MSNVFVDGLCTTRQKLRVHGAFCLSLCGKALTPTKFLNRDHKTEFSESPMAQQPIAEPAMIAESAIDSKGGAKGAQAARGGMMGGGANLAAAARSPRNSPRTHIYYILYKRRRPRGRPLALDLPLCLSLFITLPPFSQRDEVR